MTMADFVAAIFWPLVIVFAVLLKAIRDPDRRRSIALIAVAIGALYLVLTVFYLTSSLFALADIYLLGVVGGVGLMWFGWTKLQASLSDPASKLKAFGISLCGAVLVLLSGTVLILDFALPRTVLEGRVRNVRVQGRRLPEYAADIGDKTVMVTTPVYERLKFLPVVRVEVGRGSGYVFNIEYLAN
jgi:hypothetical protein